MTICRNCVHYRCVGRAIWYNERCSAEAVQLPPATDPVSGKEGFQIMNGLGMVLIVDDSKPYCRNINHGECAHFTAAKEMVN